MKACLLSRALHPRARVHCFMFAILLQFCVTVVWRCDGLWVFWCLDMGIHAPKSYAAWCGQWCKS